MTRRAKRMTPTPTPNVPAKRRSGAIAAVERVVTLRDYQGKTIAEAVRYVSSGTDVLLEGPTGSGKTLELTVVSHRLLAKGFTHAIVIVPQSQIGRGFEGRNGWTIVDGGKSVRVREGFVRVVSSGAGKSVRKAILGYLSNTDPKHVLVCTHPGFAKAMDSIPEGLDLAKRVLIVDEAHHASAARLSKAVKEWADRSGRLLFATATPYRADGKEVATEGMVHLRRTLPEHMDSGYCPRTLESRIIPFGMGAGSVTSKEFHGDAIVKGENRQRDMIALMVQQWVADGRPKTILRVPPIQGGSAPLIRSIIEAFEKAGARVLDSTGVGKDRQEAFQAALDSERQNKSYKQSRYDVVVGVQRVWEGTDWKYCSTVYCVGMPGSLPLVVQMLGRAQRDKKEIVGYPKAFRDRANITFFVPWNGDTTLDELSLDHSRQTVLIAAFLADCETKEEWAVQRIAKSLNGGKEPPVDTLGARQRRAEIKVMIAAAVEENPEATQEEIEEIVVSQIGEEERPLVRNVMGRMRLVEIGPDADVIPPHKAVVRGDLDEDMRAIFEEVLDRFRGETLVANPYIANLSGQIHSFGSRAIRGISQRLSSSLRSTWTIPMIQEAIREYHERTGKFPKENAPGKPRGLGCDNWKQVDQCLRHGYRGAPRGYTLSNLVQETLDLRWTYEKIRVAMTEYIRLNGRVPFTSCEDRVPLLAGLRCEKGPTWAVVDMSLRIGTNGLPGGSSIPKFAQEELGIKPHRVVGATLEPNRIASAILRYIDDHGKAPTRESKGGVSELGGLTWFTVDDALKRGTHGLPGGQALSEVVREVSGIIGRRCLLSVEEIKNAIADFKRNTGRFPISATKGQIPQLGGISWSSVNQLLRRGGRGFPGGSTLAKFLKEHFGVQS